MKFIADMHVHSRFSRATAKNLDLEHLYIGAQIKGIRVVATGDFTHPAWFAEIREKLVPAEPGLFRLRDDIAAVCDQDVPKNCRGEVRFVLETEISNIYKKDGATRKNHNLIFAPDMDAAARINARLDAVGNIKSDGRPILGLDAHNLLEIMLECAADAFLVPAHIWTPWFSMLGSKSGFDSITACFGDLAGEIFAVESGLSSDAPMNRRISELDTRTLISNSDAHSPANLGRNASVFDTDISFFAIRDALKAKDPARCLGTLDMYPEEGKYHMDGHRKCDVVLSPPESMALDNLCPVCGKPLTLGVLHRVAALADRPEGTIPDNILPYQYIIPLPEMLSEILGKGVNTKTVQTCFQGVLQTLGPELPVLLDLSLDHIETAGVPLMAEAIRRMRAGKIHIEPGYDGEYGRITVFEPDEKKRLMGQTALFKIANPVKKKLLSTPVRTENPPKNLKKAENHTVFASAVFKKTENDLNPEQEEAVIYEGGPLLIVAGPGAGKTRTLTRRMAWLMQERAVAPERILAVTFTQKAAQEMRERVCMLAGNSGFGKLPFTATFHALCLSILKEEEDGAFTVLGEDDQKAMIAEAVRLTGMRLGKPPLKPDVLAALISRAKQVLLGPDDDLSPVAGEHALFAAEVYRTYEELMKRESARDYDDLIFAVVRMLETNADLRQKYADRFIHILVDEYQDVNQAQYRLVRLLASPEKELCVIGDPDQSIYGFRGSDVRYFSRFAEDYPEAKIIRLSRNYRSAKAILAASHQVIRDHSAHAENMRVYSHIDGVKTLTIMETPTEKAEAVAIGRTIEKLVGGMGFHTLDFGKADGNRSTADLAFSDFAVLYRSHIQSRIIAETLESAGIPCRIISRRDHYGRKEVAGLISLLRLVEQTAIFTDFQRISDVSGETIRPAFALLRNWIYAAGFSLKDALANVKKFPVPGMDVRIQRNLCAAVDQISAFREAVSGKTVQEKLFFLLEKSGFALPVQEDSRNSDAVKELVELAGVFGTDSAGFIETVALQTDPDTRDSAAQKVSLMTLHAAKGLEFPVVFIAGCEDGFLPYQRSNGEPADADEERRLFYVGMTRAKDRLFLSRAGKRTIYGMTTERQISPFVQDIEQQLLSAQAFRRKKIEKPEQTQLGLFG